MKNIIACFMIIAFSAGTAAVSHAEETLTEKAQDTTRDAKRAVKKGANRVGEALCMEGDLKCAAKKAKNRATETKDSAVDKAKEVKESIDSK